jgi:hypothetical protein
MVLRGRTAAEGWIMDREGDAVKLNLRLDDALHQQLASAAKQSVRSLNGEIVYRLRFSFADDDWHDWPASDGGAAA